MASSRGQAASTTPHADHSALVSILQRLGAGSGESVASAILGGGSGWGQVSAFQPGDPKVPPKGSKGRSSRVSPREARISSVGGVGGGVVGKVKAKPSFERPQQSRSPSVATTEPMTSYNTSLQSSRASNETMSYNSSRNNSQNLESALNSLSSVATATGTIHSGDRLLNYTIREFVGLCMSLNIFVPVTQQTWALFLPVIDTVIPLRRLWVEQETQNALAPHDRAMEARHNEKLAKWLLSCTTLEFDGGLISAAHFDHDGFKNRYNGEVLAGFQAAAGRMVLQGGTAGVGGHASFPSALGGEGIKDSEQEEDSPRRRKKKGSPKRKGKRSGQGENDYRSVSQSRSPSPQRVGGRISAQSDQRPPFGRRTNALPQSQAPARGSLSPEKTGKDKGEAVSGVVKRSKKKIKKVRSSSQSPASASDFSVDKEDEGNGYHNLGQLEARQFKLQLQLEQNQQYQQPQQLQQLQKYPQPYGSYHLGSALDGGSLHSLDGDSMHERGAEEGRSSHSVTAPHLSAPDLQAHSFHLSPKHTGQAGAIGPNEAWGAGSSSTQALTRAATSLPALPLSAGAAGGRAGGSRETDVIGVTGGASLDERGWLRELPAPTSRDTRVPSANSGFFPGVSFSADSSVPASVSAFASAFVASAVANSSPITKAAQALVSAPVPDSVPAPVPAQVPTFAPALSPAASEQQEEFALFRSELSGVLSQVASLKERVGAQRTQLFEAQISVKAGPNSDDIDRMIEGAEAARLQRAVVAGLGEADQPSLAEGAGSRENSKNSHNGAGAVDRISDVGASQSRLITFGGKKVSQSNSNFEQPDPYSVMAAAAAAAAVA